MIFVFCCKRPRQLSNVFDLKDYLKRWKIFQFWSRTQQFFTLKTEIFIFCFKNLLCGPDLRQSCQKPSSLDNYVRGVPWILYCNFSFQTPAMMLSEIIQSSVNPLASHDQVWRELMKPLTLVNKNRMVKEEDKPIYTIKSRGYYSKSP